METVLVSNNVIISNLRRTASKGLISLLSIEVLNGLALKYFGIYKDGSLIGYQCPYSGKIITDNKEIVLEHIIPVNSNGGTVIFNCIPTSKEVNIISEKGSNHLISWWLNSKYWDKEAPERLEKILKYILEGYKIVFEQYNIDGLLKYLTNIDKENNVNNILDENANLSTTQKESQTGQQKLITYYQFLRDIIDELKRNNINTLNYENNINSLFSKGTFDGLERISIIQDLLKKIIKEKIGCNNRCELTMMLNIDIMKIVDLLKDYKNEDLYDELIKRFVFIENILNQHSISLISFLSDIKNIKNNILYKKLDDIDKRDIELFVEEINLSVSDKTSKLISWIEIRKKIPNMHSTNENEKILGTFLNNIKKNNYLSDKDLILFAKSQSILCNKIFEELVLKSLLMNAKSIINSKSDIINRIILKYIDSNGNVNFEKIEERLLLISSGKKRKSTIIELINWIDYNNRLPNQSSQDEYEKRLYYFLRNMKSKVGVRLNKIDIMEFTKSNNEIVKSLFEELILKELLENPSKILKIKDNNIAKIIELYYDNDSNYLDIKKVKKRLERIKSINNGSMSTIEELIDWIEKYNTIPNKNSNNSEEKRLGHFYSNIRTRANIIQHDLLLLSESDNSIINSLFEIIVLRMLLENEKTLENIDNTKIKLIIKNCTNDGVLDKNYIITRLNDILDNKEKKNALLNELTEWIRKHNCIPSENGNENERRLKALINNIRRSNAYSLVELSTYFDEANPFLEAMYEEFVFRYLKSKKYTDEIQTFDRCKKIIEKYKKKYGNLSDIIIDEIIVKNGKKNSQNWSDVSDFVSWVTENQRLPKREIRDSFETKMAVFWENTNRNGIKTHLELIELLNSSEPIIILLTKKYILNCLLKNNNIEMLLSEKESKQYIDEFLTNNTVDLLKVTQALSKIKIEIKENQEEKDGYYEIVKWIEENGRYPESSSERKLHDRFQKLKKSKTIPTKLLMYLDVSDNLLLSQLLEEIILKNLLLHRDIVKFSTLNHFQNLKSLYITDEIIDYKKIELRLKEIKSNNIRKSREKIQISDLTNWIISNGRYPSATAKNISNEEEQMGRKLNSLKTKTNINNDILIQMLNSNNNLIVDLAKEIILRYILNGKNIELILSSIIEAKMYDSYFVNGIPNFELIDQEIKKINSMNRKAGKTIKIIDDDERYNIRKAS